MKIRLTLTKILQMIKKGSDVKQSNVIEKEQTAMRLQ